MAELPDIEITEDNAYEIADYLYTHYGTRAPTASELMEADRKRQEAMVRKVGGRSLYDVFKALDMIQKAEDQRDSEQAIPQSGQEAAQTGLDKAGGAARTITDLLRMQ